MTTTYDLISKIAVEDLAPELRDEAKGEGFEAFTAREMNGDHVSGNALHIAWHPEFRRAGLIYVGSGSSGVTSWTDATSPEDALRRYLEEEMVN